MADRQKGVQIHRPIIYGSHARLLTDKEKETANPSHSHRWTVFLASATSPPPKAGESDDIDALPGDADDLSYMIKRVTFKLHDTYPSPSRVIDKPPFKVVETGWGEFAIQIRVQFVPESGEKPITFTHGLKLHHWGPPIEGAAPGTEDNGENQSLPQPISAGITGSTPATPVPGETKAGSVGPKATDTANSTPAPAEETEKNEKMEVDEKEKEEEEEGVKAETSTPKPPGAAENGESTPAAEGRESRAPGSQTPAGSIAADGHQTRAATHAQIAADQRVSVAAKWPVLAWQYDELVFSDPPLAFYNLLNEHPPTPLPNKNRRPRDQRDEAESKKKLKAGTSNGANARASSSRTATVEPTAAVEGQIGTPGQGEATSGAQTPGTGGLGSGGVLVGIPGEPGSADVPLEFTHEMERGEWNKLHDARKKIIDEMDRWRTKLIEHEKELTKVKEDMQAVS